MKEFIYHRSDLAKTYCKGLIGDSLLSYRSGLFLAAPRRTGKSTFLRKDLVPVLERHGFLPVYVDLWMEKTAEPAMLISSAIQNKLNLYADTISSLAKKTGIEKLSLYGVISINLNRSPVLPPNVTLADALETLVDVSKKPVALVVDEAQHALSTKEGHTAMFALKSARDIMNLAGETIKLALVFTGSNRDKLANLTLDHKQPFFGVEIQKFPLLGRDFSDKFAEHYNKELVGNKLTGYSVHTAFSILGFRPDFLRSAARSAVNKFMEDTSKNLNELLVLSAEKMKTQYEERLMEDLSKLTPLQSAVFEVLVKNHAEYFPFKDATLKAYQKILGKPVGKTSVQTALDALREKGFVWKESFGGYVLEDESYLSVFGSNNKQTNNSHNSPPQ